MKFFRSTTDDTLLYLKRNELLEELDVESIQNQKLISIIIYQEWKRNGVLEI